MPGAHVSWEEQPQIGSLSKELRAVMSVHSGVRSPRRGDWGGGALETLVCGTSEPGHSWASVKRRGSS